MSNCQMLLLALLLVAAVSVASHHASPSLLLWDLCVSLAGRLWED
jgi:hypothetical protein